jgi:hypothetical protein
VFNGFDGEAHGRANGVERFLEKGGAYCALSCTVQPAGVALVQRLPGRRRPVHLQQEHPHLLVLETRLAEDGQHLWSEISGG